LVEACRANEVKDFVNSFKFKLWILMRRLPTLWLYTSIEARPTVWSCAICHSVQPPISHSQM
jgi:hypothetical protein